VKTVQNSHRSKGGNTVLEIQSHPVRPGGGGESPSVALKRALFAGYFSINFCNRLTEPSHTV
jgi:hypothetical protein